MTGIFWSAIYHLLCYDCVTKYRSIWFLGQTRAKNILLTTTVCFGFEPHQNDFDELVWKHAFWFTQMCKWLKDALSVFCGHPAGVLLFDHSQGFWLSHSIPHFPSFPERGYLYPSSGKANGQTALCVNYQYEQFMRIGEWKHILDVNLKLLYLVNHESICTYANVIIPSRTLSLF